MSAFTPTEYRLELLMDSTIAETDGGDRSAVIREFLTLLTASDDAEDNTQAGSRLPASAPPRF